MTMTDLRSSTGWSADPSGRHQWRYFVEGEPTDLVRDGDSQSVDPRGDAPSPPLAPPTQTEQPTAPDVTGEAPATAAADSLQRSKRYLIAIGVGLVVLALAGTAAAFLWSRSDTKVTEIVSPPSPAEKATELAAKLRSELCTASTSSGCSVTSGDGVIEVYVSEYQVSEIKLESAGRQTGLWNAADVARMLRTRALDGTQRSSDGKVSWTYHPDNGFQLVAEVA
jgi:hypothetical protein